MEVAHIPSATFYGSEQITAPTQIQGEENRLYLSERGLAESLQTSLIHHTDILGLNPGSSTDGSVLWGKLCETVLFI